MCQTAVKGIGTNTRVGFQRVQQIFFNMRESVFPQLQGVFFFSLIENHPMGGKKVRISGNAFLYLRKQMGNSIAKAHVSGVFCCVVMEHIKPDAGNHCRQQGVFVGKIIINGTNGNACRRSQ